MSYPMHRLARSLRSPAFYGVFVSLPLILQGLISYFFGSQAASASAFFIPLPFFGVCWILEQCCPFETTWNQHQGDTKLDFVFTMLLLPSVVVGSEQALRLLYAGVGGLSIVSGLHAWWPRSWPWVFQLALAAVISDFFFYWIHRWSHTHAFLWRLHRTHHEVRRVYSLNAGRFNLMDGFLDFTFAFFPLIFLDVPMPVFLLFRTLSITTGTLEHVNFSYEGQPWSRVFNTAHLHRWHHSIQPEESQNNYGKILSAWDRVFGTYLYRAENRPLVCGVDESISVEPFTISRNSL